MTAVEWFADKIDDIINDGLRERVELLKEEAKEMEKQQIIDAVDYGCSNWGSDKDGEEYYNETFGSKGIDDTREDALKFLATQAQEMGLYDKIELANPNDSIFTSSQTEISDEEIEKAIIDQDIVKQEGYCHCFLEGAKWYREQIKSKQ